jgi:hypothetical protein
VSARIEARRLSTGLFVDLVSLEAMNTAAAILIVGALVQFFGGTLAYVRNTLKGKSKPNRMTFLIWAAGPFIGLGAGIAAGAAWWALLPVFAGGLGPFAIFLASFKNPAAYWKLGPLDYACGILAALALVLWVLTANPITAIVFSILADALASFPTVIKSWRHPGTETGLTYFIALCNVSLGLFVAPSHTFPQIGFLVYLFIADLTLAITANRPWLRKRRSRQP